MLVMFKENVFVWREKKVLVIVVLMVKCGVVIVGEEVDVVVDIVVFVV